MFISEFIQSFRGGKREFNRFNGFECAPFHFVVLFGRWIPSRAMLGNNNDQRFHVIGPAIFRDNESAVGQAVI
jgi:hypothetical protein